MGVEEDLDIVDERFGCLHNEVFTLRNVSRIPEEDKYYLNTFFVGQYLYQNVSSNKTLFSIISHSVTHISGVIYKIMRVFEGRNVVTGSCLHGSL